MDSPEVEVGTWDAVSAVDGSAPVDARLTLDAEPDAAPDATPVPDAAPVSDAEPDAEAPPFATCERARGAPRVVGRVGDPEITEASGLSASRLSPGVLWTHNDSGDRARLFALWDDGTPRGRLNLGGVEAVDFEDLAGAPCPDRAGPCLWVADIGDNRARREDVRIHVVPEPAVEAAFGERTTEDFTTFIATYADGPRDAEALLVEPDGRKLWIIEKVDGAPSGIYTHNAPLEVAPGGGATPLRLERVGEFSAPGVDVPLGRLITAADLHPGGARLAVRVYTGTWEYTLPPGATLANLGALTPRRVALGPLAEQQGEAVTYDASGLGLYTVSEGEAQPIHHYPCP